MKIPEKFKNPDWKILFAVGLIFIFLFVPLNKNDSDIWFDDVKTAIILSYEDKVMIADYLRQQNPSGFDARFDEDNSPRIVFLSYSDSENEAGIFMGRGDGMREALDSAFQEAPRKYRKNWKWGKIDIVQTSTEMGAPDFTKTLSFERSLNGLAFSEESRAAFIPEELVAKTLMNSENEVDFENIADYAGFDESDLKHGEKFYSFKTESIFFTNEPGGQVVELYRGHRMFDAVTPDFLLESAKAAGKYLTNAVNKHGKFDYIYLPKSDEVKDEYNIVRHAGTLYSMFELYEVTRDERLLAAAGRALEYMKQNIKKCEFAPEGTLCLIEDGDIKLGSNALAVLALAKFMEVTGDRTQLETAQGLAKWMASVQGEDGRFSIHKQDNETGKIDDHVSEYYPGEAIFALNRLYEIDGNKQWLDAAEKAVNYLIDVRDADTEIEDLNHDHWLLYGVNEMYKNRPNQKFVDHTYKIVEAIIGSQRQIDPEYQDWMGSYYTPPRSTPVATRMEGLIAAYKLLKRLGHDERALEIAAATARGIKFELQTQFSPEVAMYTPDPQTILGAFHKSLTDFEVRIDYVQHNISALLGFRDMLLNYDLMR